MKAPLLLAPLPPGIISILRLLVVALNLVVVPQARAVGLQEPHMSSLGNLFHAYRDFDRISIATGDLNDCKPYVVLNVTKYACHDMQNFGAQLIDSKSGKTINLQTTKVMVDAKSNRQYGKYLQYSQSGVFIDPELGPAQKIAFELVHWVLPGSKTMQEGYLQLTIGPSSRSYTFDFVANVAS